ncbi:MAG: hypothetical protein Q9201_003395 [Fulgogasparrea decipioides]
MAVIRSINKSPLHSGSRALENHGFVSPSTCCLLCPEKPVVSHLGYGWGDFETEEDLVEAELYDCTPKDERDHRGEYELSGSLALSLTPYSNLSESSNSPVTARSLISNPFRDPESPLDTGDVEQYKAETDELIRRATSSICQQADFMLRPVRAVPTIKPPMPSSEEDDPENSYYFSDDPASPILTASSDEELDTIDDPLEIRIACLESFVEETLSSFLLQIQEIRRLLADRNGRSSELADNNQTAVSTSAVPSAIPQQSASAITLARQYTQDWHSGGLILVENIPEHTSARGILALFQSMGIITYLELHGPDKSGPHIPTRHAFIHFADPDEAANARKHYHGFRFQGKTLMTFSLSTNTVRGVPGQPYVGPALEILNFHGGPNYIAPEMSDTAVAPLEFKRQKTPTYSHNVKPKLTLDTNVAAWRQAVVPRPVAVPQKAKPKLTINTDVPNADAIPDEQETSVVVPIAELLNPTSAQPQSLFFPSPQTGEPSSLDVLKSGVIGSGQSSSDGSEDDEMVVFQGAKKRFLRTPPAGDGGAVSEAVSEAMGEQLLPNARTQMVVDLHRVKAKGSDGLLAKATTTAGKMVAFWRWAR